MQYRLTDTHEVVCEMKSGREVTKNVLEFLTGKNWNNVLK